MIKQQLLHVHEHIFFLKLSRVRVGMKRSVHTVSASSSSDVRQCLGTTLRGVRCSVSSASKFAGKDGHDLALPLRRGCDYCLAHLTVLVTEQTAWDANTNSTKLPSQPFAYRSERRAVALPHLPSAEKHGYERP